jgi:hypothetical protein
MDWGALIPWIVAGALVYMWYTERNRRIKAEIQAKITTIREALNVIQKDMDKNKPEYQHLAMLLELKSLDDILASLGTGSPGTPNTANNSEGKIAEPSGLRPDVQPVRYGVQGTREVVGITRNRVGQIVGGQDSRIGSDSTGTGIREEEK